MTAWKQRTAAVTGAVLIAAGGTVLGVAAAAQRHAPQPGLVQAGSLGPAQNAPGLRSNRAANWVCPGPCGAMANWRRMQRPGRPTVPAFRLARSLPIAISIPAIGVTSRLQYVGLNPDGTIQVPPLNDPPLTNEAAWYKYSPTPGQDGPSIIEGHVDSVTGGASVFFRLGALKPGDLVKVTLADHQVAIFTITGVRLYQKSRFPTSTVYGNTSYPALRLITCGGSFDEQTHHYLSNIVAFASLTSAQQPQER